MRSLNPAIIAALTQPGLVIRDFVWIAAKDRGTGVATPRGLWSDVGTIVADTEDGNSRTFRGGGIVSIGRLALTADLSIRTADVELAANHATVEEIVRTLDPRLAAIQIYRGYFDPATRLLIDVAVRRFDGFVDEASVRTAGEGGDSVVTLTCVSKMRELTRANPDVRSDASQRVRSTGDRLFRFANVEFHPKWGRGKKKIGKHRKHGGRRG